MRTKKGGEQMRNLNQCKKAFLLRYNAAVKAQNEADDELDALLTIGSAIPIGDGMPHATSDMSMPERFSMRAEKIEEDLRIAFEQYSKTRREVTDAIMNLGEERLIAIMRDRYLNFKPTEYEEQHNAAAVRPRQLRMPTRLRSWEEVAERCGYAYDTVKSMHGEALEKIKVPADWVKKWEKNRESMKMLDD